ncbi:MAG: hypothetical protein R6V55_08115 [Desulfovermiculus sp.]
MGLDLRELTIPMRTLGLYQAGLCYLLDSPGQRVHPPTSPEPADKSAESKPVPQPGESSPFPTPWADLWVKLHPPYAMVWTYWQLAEDLGGSPDAQRRQLFRTILSKLGWPRGSVAFWPLSAYDGHDHHLRLDLFWSGVQAIQAQIVVVFGTPAFQALFSQTRPSFGFTTTRSGLQVVHVPGPDDMLPDKREMKNLAWNMLCPLSPRS